MFLAFQPGRAALPKGGGVGRRDQAEGQGIPLIPYWRFQ